MNTKIFLVVLASVIFMPWSVAAETPKTKDVSVALSDAYFPSGFDSRADVFVVVNGLFPNSCYSFKGGQVNHIGPTLHEVTTYATVTSGLCLMVMVPFTKEVQLGKFVVGEHKVRFMNSDGTFMEKSLTIEQ